MFSRARQLFLADGYHLSLAFLFCGRQLVHIARLEFEQRSDKYLAMRQLATEVDRKNADSVMVIGESWGAPSSGDQQFFDPSDHPDKRELLTLSACSAKAESIRLFAEIIRSSEHVSLSDTMTQNDDPLGMFESIRNVWAKRRKKPDG